MSMNIPNQSSKSSSENLDPQSQKDSSNKAQAQDGFVKLAMRNMVKKGNTSLFHFGLTVLGVFGTLVGLAVIFH